MTKKTRIRVARIAAGVVIAAGASLTAAGAPSALSLGVEADETGLHVNADLDGSETPDPGDTGIPTGPATSEPPTSAPPTSEPPSESSEPTDEPTQPTEEPTEPTDEPTDGSTSTSGTGTTGGNNNTGTDGNSGTSAQEEGSSSLTDTGSGSNTEAQGGGDQLAETGAAQTTFLIVGAATMIAGGIGFRILPRLMGGRGGAAA